MTAAPARRWAAPPDDGFGPPLYAAVGLLAGAVIALQIAIMRIFAVGSWAHFGSLVVSLAMLGFGLTSAVMCVARGWFERHWQGAADAALLLFGPLAVAANLLAQQVPFNAIFLVSDPGQKWRLLATFLLYLLPFLAGATFLGTVFLRSRTGFGRVYFADLAGSGVSGLVILAAMYVFAPENLVTVALLLWAAGGGLWFGGPGRRRRLGWLAGAAALAFAGHYALPAALHAPRLAVSDYKGVAYARKFPDSRRVYAANSPFGRLEVYASSYLHFAPGLSDNAAFALPDMPADAYLGLYIDGDGPSGVIRHLPDAQTAYFTYLPMYYPYLLKRAPRTFVVQFGGGISTALALRSGAAAVTVAEANPAVLAAFRRDPALRTMTGDILHDPRVRVVGYEGRLYLARTRERYDVIDLSLADSAGLSQPGGFAIVEKYAYTREAMAGYMRALADGGILSVTLWNKEEPPKSVLKLYATMAEAARSLDADIADRFFVVSSYLSTTTVLYKRGGFTPAEVDRLRAHTRAMSFDEIWAPGATADTGAEAALLDAYRSQLFPGAGAAADPTLDVAPDGAAEGGTDAAATAPMPATTLARLAWQHLVHGGWAGFAARYVFDVRPLTNDRPYFAAYVRPRDLPAVSDRLEQLQDEWGYLSLWATLAVAWGAALVLIAVPVAFGWRTMFRRSPGKLATILYFACLGLGYIMVEVGLIAAFTRALSNATVSASVLITGMLVFSGIGSLASGRHLDRARTLMPAVFLAIAALLAAHGLLVPRLLDGIGAVPYGLRLACCLALVAPPAFLMGFPMPTAMAMLGRLGKDHMFIWAWGINGCFSVIGAALVPIVATAFGLAAVLLTAAAAYLLALPAFFGVVLPLKGTDQSGGRAIVGREGAPPAAPAEGRGWAAHGLVPVASGGTAPGGLGRQGRG